MSDLFNDVTAERDYYILTEIVPNVSNGLKLATNGSKWISNGTKWV